MTITSDAIENAEDIVVVPEVQMEEGTMRDDDDYPAATAVIAEAVESSEALEDAMMTHGLTGSNRFVPVAVASAILPDHLNSSSEEDDLRPDLLSATVHKQTRDAALGIVLVGTTVKRVEPEGLLGSSGFQAGDRLMSVNSEGCEGLGSRGVADLMRNADGVVTVVVRAPNGNPNRVSSMVMKQSANSQVGIGFRNRAGKLIVSSVSEDGLFAHSLLNPSDTCISINGIACDEIINATAAATMIRTSPSFVTIVAKTRHETGVVVAASAAGLQLAPNVATATAHAGDIESSPPLHAQGNQSPRQKTDDDRHVCGGYLFCVVVATVIIVVVLNTNN